MNGAVGGEHPRLQRARDIANQDGDRRDRHRPPFIAVAIFEPAVTGFDGFGKFIDRIDPRSRVHPADMAVEALISEELPPGRRPISGEALIAGDFGFRSEVKAGVRVDQQQSMAISTVRRCDRKAVRAQRFGAHPAGFNVVERHLFLPVKAFELAERDAGDIATDAAFAERQCHPGFEMRDDAGFHLRMGGKIEIQRIGPRGHQRL